MRRKVAETETQPPDLADLRAFCQVVDLGSITAAARALGETKGSVSRRLTRLERALGVVLVQRSPRRVQATDDGAAYRARVGRALELLDDATARVQQARAAPSGHLRVTAPTDLGLSLLAPLVPGFVERFPGVTIELVLTEARLDFDAHQIDVAVRASGPLRDSSLVAHRLTDIAVKLYAAPGYLARHGAPRRPEDLAQHRMLMAIGAVRGRATLSLRRSGEKKEEQVRVRVAVSASDFFACKEAAAAGGGIAPLPTLVARRDLETGRLVTVLDEYEGFSGAVHLVHRGARFLQPKVRAFRDYVLEALGVRARR